MADGEQPDYTNLTVQLLSAYVANNTVASDELAALIQSTRAALVPDTSAKVADTVEHVPAVGIRKSLSSREYILSLIDGRPYKTLKRHLASHGLTPADYRARYGLPETYPMVAQDYSEQRRAVAQKLGLGQRGTEARAAAAEAAKAAAPKRKAKAPGAKAEVEAPKAQAVAKTAAPAAKRGAKPKAAQAPAADEPAKTKAPAKATRRKLGIKADAVS